MKPDNFHTNGYDNHDKHLNIWMYAANLTQPDKRDLHLRFCQENLDIFLFILIIGYCIVNNSLVTYKLSGYFSVILESSQHMF